MLSTRNLNSKIVLGQLYALWLREIKVFLREKSRLVASTFTPLLWLFVIGSGLGSTNLQIGTDYEKFIFPGIICMSVIFTSVFFGAYIIWDRKFDFLKSVMVAPSRRTTVFIGKTLGGMTTSLFQVAIVLVVGIVIGINYDALILLQILSVVLILSFCLTSLGLTFGSYIESLEGFQLIVSFIVFPLFFLSGALFPIDNLPTWLKIITLIDPATYSVDALRNSILHLGTYSFEHDIMVLLLFTLIITLIGIFSFRRMKAV
jgi:ABC-2 type transport system permease protein